MNYYISIYFLAGEAHCQSFSTEREARDYLNDIFNKGKGCPDMIVLSGFKENKIIWFAGEELDNISSL